MATEGELEAAGAIRKRLAAALGRPLRRVVCTAHVTDLALPAGVGPTHAIGLLFDGGVQLWLGDGPGGWSLRALDGAEEPVELGADGEVVLRDVTHRAGFARAVGRPLLRAALLERDGAAAGLLLELIAGEPRLLLVADGELRFAGPEVRGDGLAERPLG